MCENPPRLWSQERMIGILTIYIVITTLHYKTSRTHEHTCPSAFVPVSRRPSGSRCQCGRFEVLSPVQTTTHSVCNATSHAEAWARSRDRRDQSRVARPNAWSPGRAPRENTSRARHTIVYKTLRAAAYVGYGVSKWQTETPSTSVL